MIVYYTIKNDSLYTTGHNLILHNLYYTFKYIMQSR